ncbi:MAG: Ig-like domain-containing protein [Pseudomonadota bacterium]
MAEGITDQIDETTKALAALTTDEDTAVIEDKASETVDAARQGAEAALQRISTEINAAFKALDALDPDRAALASTAAAALDAIDGVNARLLGQDTVVTAGATNGAVLNSIDPPAPGAGASPSAEVVITIVGDFEAFEADVGLSRELGFDSAGLAFDASADITARFDYALPFLIDFAASSVEEAVRFLPESAVEARLSVDADIEVEASASLGFLEVTAEEVDAPGAQPDVTLVFAADFTEAGGATPDLSVSGQAGLQVSVESKEVTVPIAGLDVPVLPKVGAKLNVGASYATGSAIDAAGTVSASVEDVRIELLSIARLLDGVFSRFDGVLDEFPFRQIMDLLDKPIPLLDPLLNDTPLDPKDDEDVDPDFTVLDLLIIAAAFEEKPDPGPNGEPPADTQLERGIKALIALKRLDALREAIEMAVNDPDGAFDITLGSASVEEGRIVVGDQDLSIADFFGALGDLAAFVLPPDTDGGGEPETAALGGDPSTAVADATEAGSASESGLLEVPLLASPEALLEGAAALLLNGFIDEPVDLVRYTLPELRFDASASFAQFLVPPLPLIVEIFGGFGAAVQVGVGYDTEGFQNGAASFADGFHLFGALSETNSAGQQAAAIVTAGVFAKAELEAGLARAGVTGGLIGQIEAYLADLDGDGKTRANEAHCFIGALEGEIGIGLSARAEIGFGPFSVGKSVDLGPLILAQFGISPICPPSVGGTPELERDDATGLARIPLNDMDALHLHVGADAGRRQLGDAESGLDVTAPAGTPPAPTPVIDERFTVSAVGPEDGPGEVFVSAFGLLQRFDGAGGLREVIARAGRGDDSIVLGPGVVSGGVSLRALFDGGDGADILIGGDGADSLTGGTGTDLLIGGLGNDTLLGGSEADTLQGGAGADSLDGGGGAKEYDVADYGAAPSAVQIEFVSTNTVIPSAGILRGRAGDALGDTLRNIEHLVGSAFDDTLQALPLFSMILEGGDGDDTLLGGGREDLFIGGAGADRMVGDAFNLSDNAIDRTSYALSRAGVSVDLLLGRGSGGDAQGDTYIGIEHVQLTDFDDRFRSDLRDNLAEAGAGADDLRSIGGRDTLIGGDGDDTVAGALSEAVLDGGALTSALTLAPAPGDDPLAAGFDLAALAADIDTLDYSAASQGVEVKLSAGTDVGTGTARALGGQGLVDTLQGEILWPGTGDPGVRSNGRDNSFEVVIGSGFADDLLGDTDDNTLLGGRGDDVANGGEGDDLLDGGPGRDTLIGGDGQDTLLGTQGFNDMRGGAGRDLADWSGRADGPVSVDLATLVSAPAVDLGAGATAALATLGNGTQIGYLRDIEDLLGSRFNDTLRGDADANRLESGGVVLNGGTEVIDGGSGTDEVIVDLSRATDGRALVLTLDAQGEGGGFVSANNQIATLDIESIERLTVFTGGARDAVISEAGGADLVRTGGGDDVIALGRGADLVEAGAGDDTVLRLDPQVLALRVPTTFAVPEPFLLDGGLGLDSLGLDLSFETADRTLLLDAPETGAFRIVTAEGGVAKNFESLAAFIAGSGNDEIGQAGRADNILYGRAGDDRVHTGFGFDVAFGGNGTDRLVIDYSTAAPGLRMEAFVRPSNDGGPPIVAELIEPVTRVVDSSVRAQGFEGFDLTGTADADLLFGGPGADSIVGGPGADTLGGAGGFDVLTGGPGADVFKPGTPGLSGAFIKDFNGAAGDRLLLDGPAGQYRFQDEGPGEISVIANTGLAPVILAQINVIGTFDAAKHVTFVQTGSGKAVAAAADPGAVGDATTTPPSIDTGAAASDVATLLAASLERQIALPGLASTDPAQFASRLGVAVGTDAVAEAVGIHAGVLGAPGLVLSTGRVGDLLGSDTEDGAAYVAASDAPFSLEFTQLETLDFSTSVVHLYRAPLPVGAKIGAITITDPGGNTTTGARTGFDIEAIAISDKKVETADLFDGTGAKKAYTALEGLITSDNPDLAGALVFEQDQISFTPGAIVGTGTLLDGATPLGLADLGFASFGFDRQDGYLSLGDEGSVTFDLAAPLQTGKQLYVYLTEWAVKEDLTGQVQGSALPANPPGDLSTDLGRPGLEDDETRFAFRFNLEGVVAPSATNAPPRVLDLFELTIVSEEFPERTAFDLGDLLSVKVDGVDALVVDDAVSRPFSEVSGALGLALTPNTGDTGDTGTPIRGDAIATDIRIAAPISTNDEHVVEIVITDQGDAFLDTAVFLTPITRQFLRGTDAADAIDGGTGGPVEIAGLEGDDTLQGTPGDDIIRAGDGDDGVVSMGGNDDLSGGRGDDALTLGAGNETVRGGPGQDTAIVTGGGLSDATLDFDGEAWVLRGTPFGEDRLIGVERLAFAEGGVEVMLPVDLSTVIGQALTPNIAPLAGDDALTVKVLRRADGSHSLAVETGLNVLDNDLDLDATGALSAAFARLPGAAFVSPADGAPFVLAGALGALTLARDGAVGFVPDPEALDALPLGQSEDLYLYRAFDGARAGRDAQIAVQVSIEAELAVADDTATVAPGQSVLIDVLANDFAATEIALFTQGAQGTIALEGTALRYTPVPGATGSDTFQYFATDGGQQGALATVTVTVAEAVLIGSDGDDTLRGDARANTLEGGAGNDKLYGEAGEDRLLGGAGNDAIYGGAQSDTIAAGAGDDTAYGEAGSDIIRLGEGDDRFVDDAQDDLNGRDSVLGGAGNDTLNGWGGSDTLRGEAGADVVRGGLNSDLLDGGDGDDLLDGGAGPDTILGGAGEDTVHGGGGPDLITLGAGADVFHDTDQSGPVGNDTVFGGAGNDTLNGAGGDDSLDGGLNSDSLLGGAGNDLLRGGAQPDTILGGAGNDTTYGDAGADTVLLGAGDDRFVDDAQSGANGADTVLGGAGSDTLIGDGGGDSLNGGSGGDSLLGGANNDTLIGADGRDTLRGQAGDDVLRGGGLNDLLDGGSGNDLLDGGDQGDTLFAGAGDDTAAGGNGPDLINLGEGDDLFNDNAQAEPAGNDTVFGGAGNDTLNGAGGNDSLDGGLNSDSLMGGAGDDLLRGGAQSDTIMGGAGNDTVYGDAGADTILLGAGNDRFVDDAQGGLNGADTVFGGAGNDTLIGGGGADRLSGGAINDTLSGGGGADTFVFEDPATGGTDRLVDFTPGVDTIALAGAGFAALANTIAAGTLRLGTAAEDSDDFLLYAGGSLFYDADADGPGAAVRIAILNGAPVLSADDFDVL